ncbi:hypothetical protein [Halobacillus litoralis]|uniref:Uncharacterized protein n=1 Tax=Halobacillus litoralis TaxID=45668 RepID=A0A410MDZ0_9BACI|nr:hypothetical protein [Halobacillus litoralis]QAS52944.1 hypothetical protein HLI_12445 [Halobacillus litoralis]
MDEEKWEIQEIKRLKKKHLILYNLVMLLIVVSFGFYAENGGTAPLIFNLCCVVFWIITATSWCTLITGNAIGTKSTQRVLSFDKDHLGEKRWKRQKTLGTVLISVLTIGITVVLLVMEFDSVRLEFPLDATPIIGAWAGYTAGEIRNINRL